MPTRIQVLAAAALAGACGPAVDPQPPEGGGNGPVQVTLSVSTVGAGSVSVEPPGGTYPPGTTVILTASPASGYQFARWDGAIRYPNGEQVVVGDAAKVAAKAARAGSTVTILMPSQAVSVNQGSATTMTVPSTGGWGVAVPSFGTRRITTVHVNLRRGTNTIRFTAAGARVELDYIEVR